MTQQTEKPRVWKDRSSGIVALSLARREEFLVNKCEVVLVLCADLTGFPKVLFVFCFFFHLPAAQADFYGLDKSFRPQMTEETKQQSLTIDNVKPFSVF